MSLLDSNKGGIGNYKGVMLCNRPFAGIKAAAKGGSGAPTNTFKAGVIPEPLGIPIPIADKKKLVRPKKETVLTKHRKWLADLQRTKDSLEIQFIDEMNKKQESINKFQEQEKKMRLQAKELLRADEKGSPSGGDSPAGSSSSSAKGWGSSSDAGAEGKGSDAGPETTSPSGSGSGPTSSKAEAKQASRKGLHSMPAWALTQQSAESKAHAVEQKELDDEEGLLDFAAALDFDRVIQDVEVKTMMAKLAERIAQLEREVKEDGDREMDQGERKARREMLALVLSAHANAAAEGLNSSADSKESEVYAAARAVLDEDEEMGAVHSKRSVAAMLAAAKEKIANVADTVKATKAAQLAKLEPHEAKVTGGPVIVVHEPSEGTRIDGKQTVSQLPYQHRNPAI